MTKSITDIAREAGIDTSRNWERFESFARRHHAAILAELLAGVEMPEPVGAVYTINGLSHCTITKALDDTDLFTLDQCREYAAGQVLREREACAELCENKAWRLKKIAVATNSAATNTASIQASNLADAIRQRGNV